jgi:hypothetical protein
VSPKHWEQSSTALTTVPRNNPGSKTFTSVTFFIEDANGEFSYGSKLFEVGENLGGSCPAFKQPPFMWLWSPRMYGEPGNILPECKSLIFSTEMEANKNVSIAFPISVTGVIPGGDVWKTTANPETSELSESRHSRRLPQPYP